MTVLRFRLNAHCMIALLAGGMLLSSQSPASAELSNSAKRDMLVNQVVNAVKDEDCPAGLEAIKRLRQAFPSSNMISIRFFEAKCLHKAGKPLEAMEAITAYLNSEQKQKFYSDALTYYPSIEESYNKYQRARAAEKERKAEENAKLLKEKEILSNLERKDFERLAGNKLLDKYGRKCKNRKFNQIWLELQNADIDKVHDPKRYKRKDGSRFWMMEIDVSYSYRIVDCQDMKYMNSKRHHEETSYRIIVKNGRAVVR